MAFKKILLRRREDLRTWRFIRLNRLKVKEKRRLRLKTMRAHTHIKAIISNFIICSFILLPFHFQDWTEESEQVRVRTRTYVFCTKLGENKTRLFNRGKMIVFPWLSRRIRVSFFPLFFAFQTLYFHLRLFPLIAAWFQDLKTLIYSWPDRRLKAKNWTRNEFVRNVWFLYHGREWQTSNWNCESGDQIQLLFISRDATWIQRLKNLSLEWQSNVSLPVLLFNCVPGPFSGFQFAFLPGL